MGRRGGGEGYHATTSGRATGLALTATGIFTDVRKYCVEMLMEKPDAKLNIPGPHTGADRRLPM